MHNNDKQRKRGRFWLYAPMVLVAVIAATWSFAWFFVRDKAVEIIDAQLAREAARGRVWTCADRNIAGFPFRLVVSCSSLVLQQGRVSLTLGPTQLIGQIYNPRHVIVEAVGPLHFNNGVVTIGGSWTKLEASISGVRRDGFDRASLVTTQSSFTVDGLPAGAFEIAMQSSDLQIRPTPDVPQSDRSFDIALAIQGGKQAELDQWTSDQEPLQIDGAFTLSKVPFPPAHHPLLTLENWREAGGMLTIAKFDMRKGGRLLTLNGAFKIDDAHRPETTLKIAQANFSELLLRAASGGDLRAKVLKPLSPVPPDAAKGVTVPMPIKILDGEVRVAGFKTPARVLPLY